MSYNIFVEPFTRILLCHYRGSLHSLRGEVFSISTHALTYLSTEFFGETVV